MNDLTSEQLTEITQILDKHALNTPVWAFDSRVNMNATEHSDLDIIIVGEEKMPQKEFYQLKDAFEESTLSIKVDVLDWHRASAAFQKNIKLRYEVVYP